MKLIRSKGVGIYFITQNPTDIPDGVLSQLGNKIQHALHAYTPKEQKSAKAVADSFRENPEFNTYNTLLELGIGEALISVLDEKGIPTIVKKATILPPQSQMGALDDSIRNQQNQNNLLYTRYHQELDRESAYELLTKKATETLQTQERERERLLLEKQQAKEQKELQKQLLKEEAAKKREMKKVVSSATGTIGRELGKSVGKSIGGSFGKKLGGNMGASIARGIFNTLLK